MMPLASLKHMVATEGSSVQCWCKRSACSESFQIFVPKVPAKVLTKINATRSVFDDHAEGTLSFNTDCHDDVDSSGGWLPVLQVTHHVGESLRRLRLSVSCGSPGSYVKGPPKEPPK